MQGGLLTHTISMCMHTKCIQHTSVPGVPVTGTHVQAASHTYNLYTYAHKMHRTHISTWSASDRDASRRAHKQLLTHTNSICIYIYKCMHHTSMPGVPLMGTPAGGPTNSFSLILTQYVYTYKCMHYISVPGVPLMGTPAGGPIGGTSLLLTQYVYIVPVTGTPAGGPTNSFSLIH